MSDATDNRRLSGLTLVDIEIEPVPIVQPTYDNTESQTECCVIIAVVFIVIIAMAIIFH